MPIRNQKFYPLALSLLVVLLAGCSGGTSVEQLKVLPDFHFLKLNGHPIEKLNLELEKDKKLLLLYFSRPYLRG